MHRSTGLIWLLALFSALALTYCYRPPPGWWSPGKPAEFNVTIPGRVYKRLQSWTAKVSAAVSDSVGEHVVCGPVKAASTTVDSAREFPTLGFNEDWIANGTFWNSNLESRRLHLHRTHQQPLKVIVIPHSHNDPGWLHTMDSYYERHTRAVLNNVVSKLHQHPNMTFVWSEIVFLAKWYEDATSNQREKLKSLLQEGRLEIATGGWVMADEATTSLYSLVDQLIEGHQWVKNRLGVVPTTSWSIDPFGHGATFPYVLKEAGIEDMVIQRVHYAWKKLLAEKREGDFRWVQRWDGEGKHAITCHHAPFDLYSTKHSCGPFPDVCINYDFRDAGGERGEDGHYAVPITFRNVKERAELLLEQYERTASLFPHNVAMVNLGDDLRFDIPSEWDQQYLNYMRLFEFINAHPERYNAEIQFGTVSDYFKSVKERQKDPLPTFSGDFFPYSDIYSEGEPSYWTGYYSTRPYHKKIYRETENDVRSAEILFTLALNLARQRGSLAEVRVFEGLYPKLVQARRSLALFAHHDATTGTSTAATMHDYLVKLQEASKFSQEIQLNAATSLLFAHVGAKKLKRKTVKKPTVGTLTSSARVDPKGGLKFAGRKNKNHNLMFFNSLSWQRTEYVKILVGSPYVKVVGPDGSHVPSQINPVASASNGVMYFSDKWYELVFLATLPPLSLTTYAISRTKKKGARRAEKTEIFCVKNSCKDPKKFFDIKVLTEGDIALENDHMRVDFHPQTWLVSRIRYRDGRSAQVNHTFGSYSSDYSGAYIFRPEVRTEAQVPFQRPRTVMLMRGPISSEVSLHQAPLALTARLLSAGPVELQEAIFLQNTVDLRGHDLDVFMRFQTDLKSAPAPGLGNSVPPTFFTDQNGFTVEKRQKVAEIGLEGNTYPVTTMAFVEDNRRGLRFSILVDHAHGFSSFEHGRLEALIERRTPFDDGRGMQEGVTDNRATTSNYILLLERSASNIETQDYRARLPTLRAFRNSQELNYPPSLLVYSQNLPSQWPSIRLLTKTMPCDTHLLNLRTISNYHIGTNKELTTNTAILVTQKLTFSDCAHHCSNPSNVFALNSDFSGLRVTAIEPVTLTGVQSAGASKHKWTKLEDITTEPFEITSNLLTF